MLSNFTAAAVFYSIAVVAVIFAAITVFVKNIFHAALSLIVVLLSVASIYIYLNAEFLALVQILVYVGAIMVLVIFAIMLTMEMYNSRIRRYSGQRAVSLAIASAIAAGLILVAIKSAGSHTAGQACSPSLQVIGKELLTTYILPFEFISVILLAALIGAVTIGGKE